LIVRLGVDDSAVHPTEKKKKTVTGLSSSHLSLFGHLLPKPRAMIYRGVEARDDMKSPRARPS